MGADRDPRMRETLRLARAGESEQARHLLIEILNENHDNFDAWAAMAQIADDRQEAINSIQQALRLRPHDEKAQRYLDYLLANQGSEVPVSVNRSSQWFVAGLIVVVIIGLVLASIFFLPKLAQAGQSIGLSDSQTIDCAALIKKALEASDQGCYRVGRNEVCYGHNTLHARLISGANLPFNQPGHTIPINMLESFAASPLDLEKGDWGVGVFKLEANLPGTLPGQLVTLLVFGNTSVENTSGDMQIFHFTSSLGGIRCDDVPFDGILVQVADGAGFTFKVNGVDVTVQGDSILQATANQELSVTTLSGVTTVSAAGRQQTMHTGQIIKIPLGGPSGMEPEGPPNPPEDADEGILGTDCALTSAGCPSTAPPPPPANTPPPVIPTLGVTQAPTAEPTATLEPSPAPTEPQAPTETLEPTEEPTPTKAPKPTKKPKPGEEPTPTEVPVSTNEPGMSDDPTPTSLPEPTELQTTSETEPN